MSLDLEMSFPDALVPLDLHDETGAIAAAQNVLGRFEEPVDRETAAQLEVTFVAVCDLLVAAEADLAFAIVPDPPYLGVLGTIVVRQLSGGDGALERTVGELGTSRTPQLEAPIVERRASALGEGVRVHQRFAAAAHPLDEGATKTDLELSETVTWIWELDDQVDGASLLAVQFASTHIDRSVELVAMVDAFAASIRTT